MSEQMRSIEALLDKRAELIKGLREKGIEDPEVLKALDKWTVEQEQKVEAAGGTREAQLSFEIDRAKVYAEGDYIDEALDTLYDALYIAQQENKAELEGRIRSEIAAVESME